MLRCSHNVPYENKCEYCAKNALAGYYASLQVSTKSVKQKVVKAKQSK